MCTRHSKLIGLSSNLEHIMEIIAPDNQKMTHHPKETYPTYYIYTRLPLSHNHDNRVRPTQATPQDLRYTTKPPQKKNTKT